MTVDSVCCGATHCMTRFGIADMIACGAVGIAAIMLFDAVMKRSDIEPARGL